MAVYSARVSELAADLIDLEAAPHTPSKQLLARTIETLADCDKAVAALADLVELHDSFMGKPDGRMGNMEDAYYIIAKQWAQWDAARAALVKLKETPR